MRLQRTTPETTPHTTLAPFCAARGFAVNRVLVVSRTNEYSQPPCARLPASPLFEKSPPHGLQPTGSSGCRKEQTGHPIVVYLRGKRYLLVSRRRLRAHAPPHLGQEPNRAQSQNYCLCAQRDDVQDGKRRVRAQDPSEGVQPPFACLARTTQAPWSS